MTNKPVEVLDRESAVAFVHWCIETLGLGYHPDTNFEDYIDLSGNPSFAAAEVESLMNFKRQLSIIVTPTKLAWQSLRSCNYPEIIYLSQILHSFHRVHRAARSARFATVLLP